jgi:hypothetical protein
MPPHPQEGSPFFQLVRRTIQQANFAISQHPEERHRIKGHHERVNQLLSCLLRLQASSMQLSTELIEWISTSSDPLRDLRWRLEEMQTYNYDQSDDDIVTETIIPVFQLSTGGRPRYSIPWDIVMVYRETDHTWKEISKLMGISDDTLYRRRKEENIPDPISYSTTEMAGTDQDPTEFFGSRSSTNLHLKIPTGPDLIEYQIGQISSTNLRIGICNGKCIFGL